MGKMAQNYPCYGLEWANKIVFSKITDFGLEISKSDTNIIWAFIENTYFYKVSAVWLKNEACDTHWKYKIEMGVVSSFFELHP